MNFSSEIPFQAAQLTGYFLIVVAILGLILNSIVVVVIWKSVNLHSSLFYNVFALALNDCVLECSLILQNFGQEIFTFEGFCLVTKCTSAIIAQLIVFLISTDRVSSLYFLIPRYYPFRGIANFASLLAIWSFYALMNTFKFNHYRPMTSSCETELAILRSIGLAFPWIFFATSFAYYLIAKLTHSRDLARSEGFLTFGVGSNSLGFDRKIQRRARIRKLFSQTRATATQIFGTRTRNSCLRLLAILVLGYLPVSVFYNFYPVKNCQNPWSAVYSKLVWLPTLTATCLNPMKYAFRSGDFRTELRRLWLRCPGSHGSRSTSTVSAA
jgi:hypothetical protein